ncbi:MAG: class IV adenylate cyclase [Armatimonadetes bacterium]|nr:class IV adenylate cyclase [Armatimonadota bacterium]
MLGLRMAGWDLQTGRDGGVRRKRVFRLSSFAFRMPRNLEIKARCPDLDAAAAHALALGATPAGVLRQVDTYFACRHGRLKLRETEGADAELIAYQRPDRAAARASDYLAVPVPDAPALKTALANALGIRAVVAKVRRLYLYRATRIHLDEVEELGRFLELETAVEGQSDEEAAAELCAIQEALGIGTKDLLRGSYADLLLREG